MMLQYGGEGVDGDIILWIYFPSYCTLNIGIGHEFMCRYYDRVVPESLKRFILLEDLILELRKLDGLNEAT